MFWSTSKSAKKRTELHGGVISPHSSLTQLQTERQQRHQYGAGGVTAGRSIKEKQRKKNKKTKTTETNIIESYT